MKVVGEQWHVYTTNASIFTNLTVGYPHVKQLKYVDGKPFCSDIVNINRKGNGRVG